MSDVFNFRFRLSGDDWKILSEAMLSDNDFYHSKAQKDWFFNQVNRLCRDVAVPYLQKEPTPSPMIEKNVVIYQVDTETFNTLRRFAFLKQVTVTQLIQKYIVDARIIKEERRMLERKLID